MAELSEQIRELVGGILSQAAVNGVDELRGQLPYIQIDDGPITYKHFTVERADARRSSFERGPVPGRAVVYKADGSIIGELIAWVKDGYLSGLEYAWVADEPPTVLPALDQVKFQG